MHEYISTKSSFSGKYSIKNTNGVIKMELTLIKLLLMS